MEFLIACAVMISVGFSVNLGQNWIDHHRYAAAHQAMKDRL